MVRRPSPKVGEGGPTECPRLYGGVRFSSGSCLGNGVSSSQGQPEEGLNSIPKHCLSTYCVLGSAGVVRETSRNHKGSSDPARAETAPRAMPSTQQVLNTCFLVAAQSLATGMEFEPRPAPSNTPYSTTQPLVFQWERRLCKEQSTCTQKVLNQCAG